MLLLFVFFTILKNVFLLNDLVKVDFVNLCWFNFSTDFIRIDRTPALWRHSCSMYLLCFAS